MPHLPNITPPRAVAATRYVTALREGGSAPGLVEADDDGLYVVKFRGSAQGPKVLVAELIVGELGRALGLPVPEIVYIDFDPELGKAEPYPDIRHVLEHSPGRNLGLDFLPGALSFNPAVGPPPDADLAATIVWFDALVTNIDRTPRNPNLLIWHKRLWLIDHGAALYVHHGWTDPAEHARRPFTPIRDHVLLSVAGSIEDADARLAPLVTPALIERIVALVPDEWLDDDPSFSDLEENRRAYVTYLRDRLAPPRAFVEEANRARPGA